MAVQIVSDFYNLFPNKLTLVFTIASIVLIAVGNALFRRYKVNNMSRSKYSCGPTQINVVHLIILSCCYLLICSTFNDVPKFPDRLPRFRYLEAPRSLSSHLNVFHDINRSNAKNI